MPNLPGTDLFARYSATTQSGLTRQSGTLMMFGTCTGTLDTTVGVYEHGCIMVKRDTAASLNAIFQNIGTSAAPVWSELVIGTGQQSHASPAAVNATATLTAAQVATGYITSTSAAPTTMTLPTGTLLGAAINAVQGTVLDLYIDNTAGASTVTLAVAANGIKSDAANTTAASFGQLTVASGVTGVGRFTLMFSSATAYVFTRTA